MSNRCSIIGNAFEAFVQKNLFAECPKSQFWKSSMQQANFVISLNLWHMKGLAKPGLFYALGVLDPNLLEWKKFWYSWQLLRIREQAQTWLFWRRWIIDMNRYEQLTILICAKKISNGRIIWGAGEYGFVRICSAMVLFLLWELLDEIMFSGKMKAGMAIYFQRTLSINLIWLSEICCFQHRHYFHHH